MNPFFTHLQFWQEILEIFYLLHLSLTWSYGILCVVCAVIESKIKESKYLIVS